MSNFEDQLVKNRYMMLIDGSEQSRLMSYVDDQFEAVGIKCFNGAMVCDVSQDYFEQHYAAEGKQTDFDWHNVDGFYLVTAPIVQHPIRHLVEVCKVIYSADEPISFNGVLIDTVCISLSVQLMDHCFDIYFPKVFKEGFEMLDNTAYSWSIKWFCGDKEVDPFGDSVHEHLLEGSMHLSNQFGRQIGYINLKTQLQRDVENMNSKLNDVVYAMGDVLQQYRDKFEKMFGDGSNFSMLDEISNFSQRDVNKKGFVK